MRSLGEQCGTRWPTLLSEFTNCSFRNPSAVLVTRLWLCSRLWRIRPPARTHSSKQAAWPGWRERRLISAD